MELFLHVGAHRTGTSAFQELLYSNREFADGRWYYPSTGLWTEDRSHNLLATYFWDDVRPELQTNSFQAQLIELFSEISGHKKIIISAEMFEKVPIRGSRQRIAEFVRSIRNKYDLKIIYVARRQDCLVDSIFKHWVADINTRYSKRPMDLAINESPHLLFSSLVDGWVELVGKDNIFVVPYLETRPMACIDSILKVVGLEADPALQKRPTANRSLEGLSLEIKHFLNAYPCDPRSHAELVDALFELQDIDPPKRKTSIFTQFQREAFMLAFAQDNVRIRRHFVDTFDEWCSAAKAYIPFRILDKESVVLQLLEFRDKSPNVHSSLTGFVERLTAPSHQIHGPR